MQLEQSLLNKLENSGKVRTLELLRSDIKNFKNLERELSECDKEYSLGIISIKEKIDRANEELIKTKSPGYGDGLGGYVESADKKINRLEKEKEDADQELKTYISTFNSDYLNKRWILLARITTVKKVLDAMSEYDRAFITDLYVEPIGFKQVMKKYKIENNGDVYRKATNILKKVI